MTCRRRSHQLNYVLRNNIPPRLRRRRPAAGPCRAGSGCAAHNGGRSESHSDRARSDSCHARQATVAVSDLGRVRVRAPCRFHINQQSISCMAHFRSAHVNSASALGRAHSRLARFKFKFGALECHRADWRRRRRATRPSLARRRHHIARSKQPDKAKSSLVSARSRALGDGGRPAIARSANSAVILGRARVHCVWRRARGVRRELCSPAGA
jgi:hypothetical protein